MGSPQPGIFAEGSSRSWFLEFSHKPDAPLSDLAEGLKALLNLQSASVHRVVALGPMLHHLLLPESLPDNFDSFSTMGEGERCMPSTQHDLLIWLHGNDKDELLETMMDVQRLLDSVAELRLGVEGFRYRDSRDLTGFVDGTANPKADDRLEVALVPPGRRGEGGAFVLSQRWVHNLAAFSDLPVSDQEKVIGRTKVDDIELEGDDMPETSHVSRTDVKGMKIYRRSMPFANARDQGLYFLAFAQSQENFQVQLQRMAGVSGDGLYDRLTDFSRVTNSSYWFAPARQDLENLKSIS